MPRINLSRIGLGLQMALGAAAIAILATFLLATVIGTSEGQRLHRDIADQISQTATQMAETLSRGMYARLRDMQIAAELGEVRDPLVPPARTRALLESLKQSYPSYSWIGFANAQGKVLVATGGLLEGVSVAGRPWFQAGLKGLSVQDVHEANLLANLLPLASDGAPQRFVDVAAPVYAQDGALIGVIGGHLSWDWARDVRTRILPPSERTADTEVLILSRNGTVLLGNDTVPEGQFAARFLSGLDKGGLLTWPDGDVYLTATAESGAYLAYPGLGWEVVVRRNAVSALRPIEDLKKSVLDSALLIAAMVGAIGWLAAIWMTRPVRALTVAADAIAAGDHRAPIEIAGGNREVAILSRSLRRLVDGLVAREDELTLLNNSLERRVADRTRNLEDEIERRQTVEAEREALILQLRELADTDFLTGVSNRRAFVAGGERELYRARRGGREVSAIMFDIDHFKRVNDSHGHAIGDIVIRDTAQASRTALRDIDLVGRLGGEEFAVLLPDTGSAGAVVVAERLRLLVAALGFAGENAPFQVTISLGVATTDFGATPDIALAELLERADTALYSAKRGGRNRVNVAEPIAQESRDSAISR